MRGHLRSGCQLLQKCGTSHGTIRVVRSLTPTDPCFSQHGGSWCRFRSSLCVALNQSPSFSPSQIVSNSRHLALTNSRSASVPRSFAASTIESSIDSDTEENSPHSPIERRSVFQGEEQLPIDSRSLSSHHRLRNETAIMKDSKLSTRRKDQPPMIPTELKEETLLSKELSQLEEVRQGLDRRSGGRRKIKPNLQVFYLRGKTAKKSTVFEAINQVE